MGFVKLIKGLLNLFSILPQVLINFMCFSAIQVFNQILVPYKKDIRCYKRSQQPVKRTISWLQKEQISKYNVRQRRMQFSACKNNLLGGSVTSLAHILFNIKDLARLEKFIPTGLHCEPHNPYLRNVLLCCS
jgi:hypothetical protein